MKRQPSNGLFITTLATILFGFVPTEVLAEPISVRPNFSSPITTEGTSNSDRDSGDCGYVSQAPDEVIKVTERINYMQIRVKGEKENPNLLIQGPEQRFCILGDQGKATSMSGVWMPGQYKIYIGQKQGESSQYTLDLSTQH